MKTLLALVLTASLSFAADDKKEDPIVGNWIWPGPYFVTVSADGTAVNKQGDKATWTFINDKVVERKYRFLWHEGVFIQNLTLSKDMKTLEGKDNVGNRLLVRRVPDEKQK